MDLLSCGAGDSPALLTQGAETFLFKVFRNFAELFQCRFKVVGDLAGNDVWRGRLALSSSASSFSQKMSRLSLSRLMSSS